MSKFNVNDEVVVIATGEKGVVKAKEITMTTDGSKHTTIQYMVKMGNGFSNWKVFSRKELQKVPKEVMPSDNYIAKTYDAPNGYRLTMVALTTTIRHTDFGTVVNNNDEETWYYIPFKIKERKLNIGYSICNPNDLFDHKVGIGLAKKRLHTKPFVYMSSEFCGEFNKETVEAIMDVKAKYIINNFDNFILKN